MHFTWTFSFLKKIIQILNAKPPQPLTHKSKLGLSSGSSNLCSSVANKMKKEERKVCYFCQASLSILFFWNCKVLTRWTYLCYIYLKVYVREQAAPGPFVSTAEMMNKFQSNTRGLSMPRFNSSISHVITKAHFTHALWNLAAPNVCISFLRYCLSYSNFPHL
jgi:hypothetical protein